MTRQYAAAILPIITAFANGERIQHYSKLCEEWRDIAVPSFSDEQDQYRIAPKSEDAELLRDCAENWCMSADIRDHFRAIADKLEKLEEAAQ